MGNEGMFMLIHDKYQEWKEKMKYKLINLGSDVYNLVCNGCTRSPPSSEELQKNNVAVNEFNGNIPDSTLGQVMHYEAPKEVWGNFQVIHEGNSKEHCSSREPSGNLISKDMSKDECDDKKTFVISKGVTSSKEERLEKVLTLRRKLAFP